MTRLTLSTGEVINLQTAPPNKFRGIRLPGSALVVAETPDYSVSIHWYQNQYFFIDLRQYFFRKEVWLNTREARSGVRMDMMLAGQLHCNDRKGNEMILLPGQYRLSTDQRFQSHCRVGEQIAYVSVLFNQSLLDELNEPAKVRPMGPRIMPEPMRMQVQQMLSNPYVEGMRNFYYDICARELLLQHVSLAPSKMPGEITQAEIAACYAADLIIAADLSRHIPIRELAKMVGTNVFVLKNGFPKVFGTGVFERLVQLKMEKARFLLASTDKSVQEISELAGYETITGFIITFKKRFLVSPKDWRKKNRGLL